MPFILLQIIMAVFLVQNGRLQNSHLVLCAYIRYIYSFVSGETLYLLFGATCHVTSYGWKQSVTTVKIIESVT